MISVSFDDFFIFKPCKMQGTLKAGLKKPKPLDLEKLARSLQARGFTVLSVEPHLLVSKNDYHLTVFPTGQIVAKNLTDREAFRKLCEEAFKASV